MPSVRPLLLPALLGLLLVAVARAPDRPAPRPAGAPLPAVPGSPVAARGLETRRPVGLPEPAEALSPRRLGRSVGRRHPARASGIGSRSLQDWAADRLPPNAAPVARDDVVTTDEGLPVVFDVLANDTDPDDHPLRVDRWQYDPPNGTVFMLPDGRLRYVPFEGFHGTETVTYLVTDGRDSAGGTVTITVRPVNDPPQAFNDAYRFVHGPAANPNARVPYRPAEMWSVLDNDTDADGYPTRVVEVDTTGLVGSVEMAEDGTFTWAGPAGFYGQTHFRYRVADDGGVGSDWATVKLWALPDPPADDAVVANPDVFEVGDNPRTANVLANDVGAAYAVLVGRPPARRVVRFDFDGTLRYDPGKVPEGCELTYRAYSADGTSAAVERPPSDR